MQKDMFSLFEQADSVAETVVANPTGPPDNINEKIGILLDAFSVGPITTFDAEIIVHRGQAVIGEMRSMGYVIETISTADGSAYVYHGFDGSTLVKTTRSVQEQYYATSHWRSTSKKRKQLDGFRCVQCGSVDDLETHHWRYNLFNEDIGIDLVTLCSECHKRTHEAIKGSSVHFPRRITQSMFERIKAEANDNNNDSTDGSQAAIGESVNTGGCASDSGQSSGNQDSSGIGWGIAEDSKSGSGNQAQG